MITDTNLMEIVFYVKFSCVFVFFLTSTYIHLQKLKQAVPPKQCRPGQDDYRHKFDGSRPIMDPSLLAGHLYNTPHGLLGVPFSGQT